MEKSAILNLLYQERNRLFQKHQRPGWNLWATIGSLSTLIWIFLSLFETKPIEPKLVIPIFIIFYTSYYFLVITIKLFSSSRHFSQNIKETRYFLPNKELSYIRFNIVLNQIVLIFLLYACYNLNFFNVPFQLIFNILVLTLVCLLTVVFIITFLPIPIPFKVSIKPPKIKKYFIIAFCFLTILTIPLLINLLANLNSSKAEIILAVKYSLIFGGFYYLALLLYKILRPNRLLNQVDTLIDLALFNKRTPEEIMSDFEIMSLGFELRGFFELTLYNYLNAHKEFINLCDRIIQKIEGLEKTGMIKLNKDSIKILSNSIKEIRVDTQLLYHSFTIVDRYGNDIIMKIKLFTLFEPDNEYLSTIIPSMTERTHQTRVKFDLLKEKVNHLETLVDELFKAFKGNEVTEKANNIFEEIIKSKI